MTRKGLNRSGITATSILVCLLISAGALLMGISFSPHLRPTKLIVTPAVMDLGEVNEGTISGSFELVNTGPKPIKIHGIEKSCTCNDVVATSEVAPFSKNKAQYSWTLKGANGDTRGMYVVHYSIDEPNAVRQSLPVQLKARVRPDFVFNKDTVTMYLDSVQQNEIVKIVPVAQTDTELLSVESNHQVVGTKKVDQFSFEVFRNGNIDLKGRESGALIFVTTNSKNRPLDVVHVYFRHLPDSQSEK